MNFAKLDPSRFNPQPKIIKKLIGKMDKKKNCTFLKKKLDEIFSLYIRQRFSDSNGMVKCFTSGKILHWTEAHCGHFVSRRCLPTRWDEVNCQVQSVAENIFNQGNAPVFGQRLNEKYGVKTVDGLLVKSKNKMKMDVFVYGILIEEYKLKLKFLNK